MKIIPEKPIDNIYIEELQEISKITGDSIEETLKNAIAILHKDWVDKKLIKQNNRSKLYTTYTCSYSNNERGRQSELFHKHRLTE